jgi:hypothetical protein
VVVLDIALADGVARIEARGGSTAPRPVRLGAGVLAGLLVLGVVTTASGWVRMVPEPLLPGSVRDSDELRRPDEQLAFLPDLVGPTDVVVAARDSDNRLIPALAGRTLALVVPRPFVDDADARATAARAFLDPRTSPADRREIQDDYDVRFVLLQVGDGSDTALLDQLLAEGGTVVHEDDDYRLVALAGSADG